MRNTWTAKVGLLASTVALICTGLLPGGQATPRPPDGFEAVFNGRDLTGWEGSPAYWKVEDGCLTGRADGTLKYNRFITWRGGKVRNFELRVRVKVSPGGNSGIQYRGTERPDLGDSVVTGYQCDVVAGRADYDGMLYEERGRRILAHTGEKVVIDTGGQPWVVGAFPLREFKAGEWHEYRVLVEGNRHRHWIDGHPTVDVIDLDEKGRKLEGVLAVQVHVGPPMKIQYKDFFLKRLPDDLPVIKPDQAKIPPSAQKVVPQGKDKPKRPQASGPWNLERLRQAPKVTLFEEGKLLTALYYEGEPYQNERTRVFAYLARPEKAGGKRPGMVLVHGGGGTAFKEWAELWAKRGYVALAMDLAGHGADRKRLPDGGPNQDDRAKFGAEQVQDFWSYQAIANVIRGVSLLADLPDVDPQRLGISGISWGGYLTCIVAGLDDRLRVAVPVYGCGFIHENSAWVDTFQKMPEAKRKLWVENFEPSRYLGQARIPLLFVNGTNDFAYPLDSYQKSYRLVKDRALGVTVDMPHGHPQGWAPVEIGLFVDHYLRRGKPLARVEAVKRQRARVEVKFDARVPVERAALHYTTDTGPWQKRAWQTKPAQVTGDVVRAELPSTRPLVYFLTLTDSQKATISTEHEVVDEP